MTASPLTAADQLARLHPMLYAQVASWARTGEDPDPICRRLADSHKPEVVGWVRETMAMLAAEGRA